MDLVREATHLHAFNYNFRGLASVSFPVPLYPLVGPGVLVETFEEGRHVSEFVARWAPKRAIGVLPRGATGRGARSSV